jgi:transposase
MHLDLARLPDDTALLQQLVRDLAGYLDRQTAELDESKARLAARDAEIEKLQLFLAVLRRQRFGRSSEKNHPDQLALQLEAIEEQIAALEAKRDPAPAEPAAEPRKNPAGGRCRSICRARRAGTNPRAAPARPVAVRCT